MDYVIGKSKKVSKFFELCFFDISFKWAVHSFAVVMLFCMVVANFVLIVIMVHL